MYFGDVTKIVVLNEQTLIKISNSLEENDK